MSTPSMDRRNIRTGMDSWAPTSMKFAEYDTIPRARDIVTTLS